MHSRPHGNLHGTSRPSPPRIAGWTKWRGGPQILLACLGLLAVLASGCSSLARSSLDAIHLAIAGDRPGAVPSAQEVADNPYAQISVDAGHGAAVLVLGGVDDGRQAWYSGDGRIIYLRDGVLEGSAGLSENAAAIRIAGGRIPFHDAAAAAHTVSTVREYDWMPGYRYGVRVEGRLQRLEHATVDILGVAHDVIRFRERLAGPGIDATNEYWVDPASGFVWKSRQMLTPDISLEIVQLKPHRPEPH